MERIEKKYFIERSDKLFSFIRKNKLTQEFVDRKILSIYYDNQNFESFNDAVEGTRPRAKIRLRKYFNNNLLNIPKNLKFFNSDTFTLENKITNFKTNIKTKKKIRFNDKYYKFQNEFYGVIYPKTITYYSRKYFVFGKERITFDYNIKYYKIDQYLNTHFNKVEDNIILEYKAPKDNINSLMNKLNHLNLRYSKYLSSY